MPRLRAFAFALFLVGPVLLAGFAAGQDLRVYHVDVGQGDSTLIIGPTGIACLVDAGDVGHGTNDVVPLLNQLGVTQLKWMVMTHHHSDHYGSVPEIVSAGFLPQLAVYDRGTVNQPTGSLFTQYLSAIGNKRTTMTAGTVLDLGGGATLDVPLRQRSRDRGRSVPVAGTSQEENSRSIALKLAYGNYQEAICGDLTGGGSSSANVESIVGPLMGNVDVYKVHHHGSFTSSSASFVSTIAPEICSISCGDGNPYGHPHQSVLNTLTAQSTVAQIYRIEQGDPTSIGGTVVNGTLLIQTNGQQYTCSGGQIVPLTRNVDEIGGGPPPSSFSVGDVVVSEFFPNPSVVPDSTGEWLELRNATPNTINLVGFIVRDQGIDTFQLPSLSVPPHGFITLGASGASPGNGGYTPALRLARELVLPRELGGRDRDRRPGRPRRRRLRVWDRHGHLGPERVVDRAQGRDRASVALELRDVDRDLRRGRPRDAERGQQPGPHAALGLARRLGRGHAGRARHAHAVRLGTSGKPYQLALSDCGDAGDRACRPTAGPSTSRWAGCSTSRSRRTTASPAASRER